MRFTFSVRPAYNSTATVIFSEERIEDFEEVLRKDDRTSYGQRFRSFIDFEVYIGLGKAGLIPTFKVSKVILDEQREWWKDQHAAVSLDESEARVLYTGLRKLEVFLSGILESNPDQATRLTAIQNDLERVTGLIDYYQSHGQSLDERSASVKSLTMLKAAALCEIIEREQRRNGQPRVVAKALSDEIYEIVRLLRSETFLEVPLPDWMRDYIAFSEQVKSGSVVVDLREGAVAFERASVPSALFLSSTCIDLIDLREGLARFLEGKGIIVVRSEDPRFHDGSQGHPHDVCLRKVDETPSFLLVVDREAGSEYAGTQSKYQGFTITHAETMRAREDTSKKLHCFIRNDVWLCYDVWVQNGRRTDFAYKGLNNRVFVLLDYVVSQNLWWMPFFHLEDLKTKVAARLGI